MDDQSTSQETDNQEEPPSMEEFLPMFSDKDSTNNENNANDAIQSESATSDANNNLLAEPQEPEEMNGDVEDFWNKFQDYQQSHPNGETDDDNDDGDNDDGMMAQLMGSMFGGGANNINQPSQSSGNNNSGQDGQMMQALMSMMK